MKNCSGCSFFAFEKKNSAHHSLSQSISYFACLLAFCLSLSLQAQQQPADLLRMAATTRRARAGGAKPEGAARSTKATMKATRMQNNLWSLSATIARRLCDPGDALALCLVAAALLVGECFLCALVIVKVPCEQRSCFLMRMEREKKGKKLTETVSSGLSSSPPPCAPSLSQTIYLSLALSKQKTKQPLSLSLTHTHTQTRRSTGRPTWKRSAASWRGRETTRT